MTAVLQAERLTKQFAKDDSAIVALRDFALSVEEGSFVTVLGRSGCGKSTMLNLLAGLTEPTEGTVSHRGKPLTGPDIDIGYLTQSDTLMPWRDVQRNVEMPLEIRGGVRAKERRRTAAALLNRVGLDGFGKHYPRELSGGMRRRASLARMLAGSPSTLLMDEPFGALDAQLRTELQEELLRLWQGSGQTVVFVTHDIEEALLLGDRIVVLGALGRIVADERITLQRPRHVDALRVDPEFVRLHTTMAAALKEGSS
ncbi:ABC transporter ATP-binding protein [Streptomyces nanshensis]|uniref:Nitrate ABC transporter ATP-binding protein n=1 Tax=Streptomyces nanshensis TaxID=518642 RepID=A0A1E7KH29_9ACTN|nr:ABC transporter ATP-binding protein [Streptomyces nanshensis]OEV03248.1 nitrate ABC transporter ATP-binding protein [Streptomyces nanshensis]